MFIMFDANVWRSQLVLNSPAGAAVRFYIRQYGATVAVPEIVRLELAQVLRVFLDGLTDDIRKKHNNLLAVFGTLKEIVLPTPDQIREKVSVVLSHLDVPTVELPFSLDVAKSSLRKIIEKMPPSDKTEEFRDGVIWAHCLDLLSEADVYLVTADKAFYSGRDYPNGLAHNLKSEVTKTNRELALCHDISELLESIRREVQIDETKLVDSLLTGATSTRVNSMLNKAGFVIEGPAEIEAKVYATEVSNRLYVDFVIKYRCPDSSGQDRSEAVLEIRGDGSYEPTKNEYRDLQSHGEKLAYTDGDGQQTAESTVLMAGSIVLGHRSVVHTVRVPLS
jgi:hypothetical protein